MLVWEDIEFAHDCIRIRPGRIGQIVKPIPFKGAMPSLNAIKTEYFVKAYNRPFKLTFVNSALYPPASPAWAEINNLIEKAIEIHRFSQLPRLVKPRRKPVKKETAPVPEISKEEKTRPDYLKVLAVRQSPHYKLITIHEKYGGRSEESHIYRFETGSGRLLIVWENTTASRAAYLFIADRTTLTDRLSRIEAFISTEDVVFKRSRFRKLKENKQLRSELGFIGSVSHETVHQFQTDIQTYINRY